MNDWYVIRSGAGESAWNMALDEALLQQAPRLGRPVLRFYAWREPAATFGFFQSYDEVARWTPLRPLIRRPTGGGLVPHAADWTYSVAIPPGDPWYALAARDSYLRLHQWLMTAFASLRLATGLCPEKRPILPGQCFAGAEQFDLLRNERKLAGAAQRRSRTALLIQGSIQPPPDDITRTDFEASLLETARQLWQVQWIAWEPDAPLLACATELASAKYSQGAYNQKRRQTGIA